MIDGIEYDEHSIQLQPGDRVYYYSDGVPEAMSEKMELFSDKRMLSVLAACSDRSLSESVEHLFQAVSDWCRPVGPKDDVSILACEINRNSAF
jgi:sigma-B regulation protein RsbU (phosphoserine phosphatase)